MEEKMSRDLVIVANHIKRLRLKSGLSIEELSKLSGVPNREIKRIEAYYKDVFVNDIIAIGNVLNFKVVVLEV